MLYEITFKRRITQYRTVKVHGFSAKDAKKIAREIAKDETEANEHREEYGGEWCGDAVGQIILVCYEQIP